jgi:large subunit ribosomal protein L7Ae
MTKTSKSDNKKTAPAPAKRAGKQDGKDFNSQHPHLFAKDARDYRIGRDVQPKRDLSRMVKWPRYVRLQRQRAILKKRLKVPPAINQFSHTLDKNSADLVFKLLKHYVPESKEAKKKRLMEEAKAQAKDSKDAKGGEKKSEKPLLLKYGINHITTLVEQKKAKLVVIAHDVDPIEIVVWLPALCRKMDVPYCIVKGKARLGAFVHKKSVTALAVTETRPADAAALAQVVTAVRARYNDESTMLRKWGGGIMGPKAQAVIKRREKLAAREASRALAGH